MAVLINTTNNIFNVIEYVDTKNDSGIINEMISYVQKYLRKEYDMELTKKELLNNDIYSYEINREEFKLKLFMNVSNNGYVWSTIEKKTILTIECQKCKRVVPKIFKVKSKYENFYDELRDSVLKRSDKEITEKRINDKKKKEINVDIDFKSRRELLSNMFKKNKI
jgi:hypothetical protein